VARAIQPTNRRRLGALISLSSFGKARQKPLTFAVALLRDGREDVVVVVAVVVGVLMPRPKTEQGRPRTTFSPFHRSFAISLT